MATINNSVVIGNDGFLIFFDNVRVDQFVTDYSTNMGVNSSIGTATINMIYLPDFDKITHLDNIDSANLLTAIKDDWANYTGIDNGIESMTDVRIFVKNTFNDKYVEIFAGNITGKSTTISGGGEKRISFQAQDFMNWLNRTICPIAVPYDETLTLGDRLKWQAQGIDIDKVQTVNTIADVTFKGKTLSQTWETIATQTIKANSLYSDEQTVAHWNDAVNRVVVMGDIKEYLREAEVMDFMITTSVTQVDTIYVMMNDILNSLMFEFFQDRDEVIRIKPPFWNEDVLKNHVIDPSLILSMTTSSDFTRMYTRSIATGALEEWHRDSVGGSSESANIISLITPVAAVTTGGTESTTGCIAVTSEAGAYNSGVGGSNISTKAVNIALAQIGKPYVWGGAGPDSFDCSGLIDYAYRQAGYTGFGGGRETTYTLVNRGRAVYSIEDVLPGDIILPHSGHVYMAISKTEIVEAQKSGTNVLRRAMPQNFWAIRRLVEWDGLSNSEAKKEVKMESVGDETLLKPTLLERRYGPLIYESTQPLIKFSNATAVDNSLNNYWTGTNHGSAYFALTKYARYMLNYLNSNVEVASLQLKAMPWLRPGFNTWVDPLSLDKIYYINTINHYGNESGNYTNVTLSLGRRRIDFVKNSNSLGGLNPGQPDDIFVSDLLITPKNFGDVCNYDEIKKKVTDFYRGQGTLSKEIFANNEYFKYFYGNENQGTAYASEVPPATQVTATSASVSTAPSLDRILKNTNPMMHGEDVTNTQTYLANAGYNPGKIDGWYGPITEAAVRAYQQDNNLSVDGQVGPLTWGKLTEGINSTGNTSASSSGGYGSGIVHVSSIGLCVRTGPSTSYPQIGSLWNGDTVQIIKEQDGWYNIVFNNETNAWSSGNYITKTSEPSNIMEDVGESANKQYSSKYASYASIADLGSDMTIKQIQDKLNQKYNNTNVAVVKDRSSRLQRLVNNSTKLLKMINESSYVDKPFSTMTGSVTVPGNNQ